MSVSCSVSLEDRSEGTPEIIGRRVRRERRDRVRFRYLQVDWNGGGLDKISLNECMIKFVTCKSIHTLHVIISHECSCTFEAPF